MKRIVPTPSPALFTGLEACISCPPLPLISPSLFGCFRGVPPGLQVLGPPEALPVSLPPGELRTLLTSFALPVPADIPCSLLRCPQVPTGIYNKLLLVGGPALALPNQLPEPGRVFFGCKPTLGWGVFWQKHSGSLLLLEAGVSMRHILVGQVATACRMSARQQDPAPPTIPHLLPCCSQCLQSPGPQPDE